MMKRIAAMAMLCAIGANVWSQQVVGNLPDSVRKLDEVVVTGKLTFQEVMPSQKLKGEQLERLNTHSVADALRYFSGLQIKDYGGVGGIKTVNIRSMGTNHLGIYYDGIELGNAHNELLRFLEQGDLPAGCTLLGLSALPSSHPLNMGMLGMHGNLGPNVMTNQCDLLIAVGMRFDDRVTGSLATYARQAKIIHFDIDPSEIDKNVKVDLAVVGDCKQTLPRVTELLDKATHKAWIEGFRPYAEKEMQKVIEPAIHPTEGSLLMGEVVRAVSEATGNKAILVTDVGQNQMFGCRYFKFTEGRSVVTSGGCGTMGFGLPAGIGATFGAPERTVCVFCGDGGLQMTIQELGTIMEQKAPVKIILLNNNYLGNVRQWQYMFFRKRYSFTPMLNPDYEQIASAYGIASRTVTERVDLDDAIRQMLETDGPFLLQCAVKEEDNVLPMTPPGANVDEMLLEVK